MPSITIRPGDETDFDQTNVDELQASLGRLTANVDRWKQRNYCTITGDDGIDQLTDEHLETGVYHDFELAADLVKKLRLRRDSGSRYTLLPVANCGTAFCVAGDVDVHNGWTFVGSPHDTYTMHVIPTSDVPQMLEDGYADHVREAHHVAREVLNVSDADATTLFAPDNSLVRIWTFGYALTGGRLTLPDALPAVDPRVNDDVTGSPELKTAQAVRDAVMIDLAGYTWLHDNTDRFYRLLDLERLSELAHGVAGRALITKLGYNPIMVENVIEAAKMYLADKIDD